jgi:hypothetical protein
MRSNEKVKMELIDIIKTTISIFSAIVFVSIAISYAIYKIKNRSRIKPYVRLDADKSIYGIILNRKELELTTNIEKANGMGNQSKLANYSMQHKFSLVNVNNKLSKTDNAGSISLSPMNNAGFKNKRYS